MLNPYLLVGTIVKPQGVRGEVKLHPETDDPERFLSLKEAYLRRGDEYEPVTILSARVSGGEAYLTLPGVTDRDEAEKLRNLGVYVDRAHARQLSDNEVFIADLLGESHGQRRPGNRHRNRRAAKPWDGRAGVFHPARPDDGPVFKAADRVAVAGRRPHGAGRANPCGGGVV